MILFNVSIWPFTFGLMSKQWIKLSYIVGGQVLVQHVWYLACSLKKEAAFICSKYSVTSVIKY